MFFRLLAVGLLLSGNAFADVYACKGPGGEKTYSDKPCPSGAKTTAKLVIKKAVQSPQYQKWCDVGSASEALINACTAIWKPAMRDPASTTPSRGRLVKSNDSGERSIFVNARSRNGFGGLTFIQFQCGVTTDDRIDLAGTRAWLDAYRPNGTFADTGIPTYCGP
jgi:hypothetical protein